jgi:DASS family divalent anion:Na+ symporter
MGGWGWLPLFVASLLVYFYAHYAFASITVHLVSMYPAFVSVLLAAGAPPLLVVSVFAFTANFAAGLTHYGTTPAPIVFSLGYVSQPTWWKVGLGMSLVNLGIWLTIGMLWWKLVGLW